MSDDKMDFGGGEAALLRAMVLLKDEEDLTRQISDLLASIEANKSVTVNEMCAVLALQRDDANRKKRITELLQEILKWWKLLVKDREELLLTISNLVMEKETARKKENDPKEIYRPIIGSTKRSQKLAQSANTSIDEEAFNASNANMQEHADTNPA